MRGLKEVFKSKVYFRESATRGVLGEQQMSEQRKTEWFLYRLRRQ